MKFGCQICESVYKLTAHHVAGGKTEHRDNNPYQQIWENLGVKKVLLCKCCHDSVHMTNRKITKYNKYFNIGGEKNQTNKTKRKM